MKLVLDALPMLVAGAVVAVGCQSAAIGVRDAGADGRVDPPDQGWLPDAEPVDEGLDAGDDAAIAPDAGQPREPRSPDAPGAPDPPVIAWVDLAAADVAASTPEIAPAVAPTLTPCPDGWREVTIGTDPTTCDPWPEGGPQSCADAMLHLPGTSGCTSVGVACPEGRWAEGLPPSGVLYVATDGLASGATGTQASPFLTIADALAAVSPGLPTIVALAKGTYSAAVTVAAANVTFRGACAAETIVTTTSTTRAVVQVDSAGVALEDVSVVAGLDGIRVTTAAGLALRGVHVRGARDDGIEVRGGSVSAERLRVSGAAGSGIDVEGRAELRHVVVDRLLGSTDDHAILLESATTTGVIEDSAVLFVPWRGIQVQGAAATLARVAVQSATWAAVYVDAAGSISGSRVVVRGTGPAPGATAGAISANGGGRVELSEVELDDNVDIGVYAAGATLILRDAVVRDARVGNDATGMLCHRSAGCTLEHSYVARNQRVNVGVSDRSTTLAATDVVTDSGGTAGSVVAGYHSTLTLTRFRVQGSQGHGVHGNTSSEIAAQDLVVSGTRPGLDESAGLFLHGASAVVTRALVQDTAGPGALVTERIDEAGVRNLGTLELLDVVIRDVATDTTADDRAALVGRAAATISATHLLVAGPNVGVVQASHLGTNVELVDALVVRSGPPDPDGAALVAQDEATLDATRLDLRLAGAAGLRVLQGARATLTHTRWLAAGSDAAVSLGAAASVHSGATCVLTRAVFEDSTRVALAGDGAGASLTLSDAEVRDVGFVVDGVGPASVGLWIANGAMATSNRALVSGARGIGVMIEGRGSLLEAESLSVAGPEDAVPGLGYGLVARAGAAFDGSAVQVERATAIAIGAFGAGTTMTLEDLAVTSTGSSEGGPAVGLGAFGGASTSATAFMIADSAECGLEVADGAGLDVSSGAVRDNVVGACVLIAGYDLGRLRSAVVYTRNGRDVDTTTRSAPAVPSP